MRNKVCLLDNLFARDSLLRAGLHLDNRGCDDLHARMILNCLIASLETEYATAGPQDSKQAKETESLCVNRSHSNNVSTAVSDRVQQLATVNSTNDSQSGLAGLITQMKITTDGFTLASSVLGIYRGRVLNVFFGRFVLGIRIGRKPAAGTGITKPGLGAPRSLRSADAVDCAGYV